MRVLHITPSVGPSSFGLGPVVLNLALEQCKAGIDARVWCTDSLEDAKWAAESSGLSIDRIRSFSVLGPRRLAFSPAMERAAVIAQMKVDLVHQHGLWSATSRSVAILRNRTQMPTVIAAHGALQRWAIERSRVRKWGAANLYEKRNLRDASCLHAVSESEVGDYRSYSLTNPVAVIPNGISESWLDSRGNGGRFREAYGLGRDKRLMLFLSRITPVKGLPIALKAVAALREELKDWIFVVGGVDERGHQREVEQIAEDLHLGSLVRFVGPLYGQMKRDAFAASEFFVLPSLGDAAPMVVLEALAADLPVVTTRGTPWADLGRRGCGWWVDASTEGIRHGLGEATSLDQRELRAMGIRGRELVASSYSWGAQSQLTIRLYSWLSGNGRRPDFVRLD